MSTSWTTSSWRDKTIKQNVDYGKKNEQLPKVIDKLSQLPPLVSASEVERLRAQLKQVAEGKAFLLQGGDCAELFSMCSQQPIEARMSLLLLMSLIIIHGARMPVVRILRGAGQYAKPRSKPTEMVNGVEVLSFRGDNVNGYDLSERDPDPDRLLQAYYHSGITLNYIRTALSSGFADLHHPRDWSLSHVRNKQLHAAFEDIVDRLEDSLDFMRVVGADSAATSGGPLQSVDLFTSHEGLLLDYEEALTRLLDNPTAAGTTRSASSSPSPRPSPQEYYCTSGHFLWIGDRTRQIDGAHIEYFRGIRNPIGLKCGPTLEADELLRLLEILDPDKEPGRLTLICRYGADKIDQCLPAHIKAVQASGHPVIFCCDAMHGNTKTTSAGIKTRHLADIVVEISKSIEIHDQLHSRLGGVHLELTPELDKDGFSVTECIGGSMELEDADLSLRYTSFCDPRLNFEQSLDIAFLISNYFQNERKGKRRENAILSGLQSRSSSQQPASRAAV